MSTTQVKVRKAKAGFYYNEKYASQDRKCVRGCTILKGGRYLVVYVVPQGSITKRVLFCGKHYGTCELCGGPVFKKANGFFLRFDSEGCAEEHFRRAELDAEENALNMGLALDGESY